MRRNQRFFIRLAVLTTTLIMSPHSVGEIIFQEDLSGHSVNFSINSANGWSQLWSSEQVKIASGDPDFTGNYANGTDRYGIWGDASHYNEAGIGSAGMDPDLEYHFSFRWKMGGATPTVVDLAFTTTSPKIAANPRSGPTNPSMMKPGCFCGW